MTTETADDYDRGIDGSIETGVTVTGRAGDMDGTEEALRQALGDADGVHITIDKHFNGRTFVKVLTAKPTVDPERVPPVPTAAHDQLRDWGYECIGEQGSSGNFVYEKEGRDDG